MPKLAAKPTLEKSTAPMPKPAAPAMMMAGVTLLANIAIMC